MTGNEIKYLPPLPHFPHKEYGVWGTRYSLGINSYEREDGEAGLAGQRGREPGGECYLSE